MAPNDWDNDAVRRGDGATRHMAITPNDATPLDPVPRGVLCMEEGTITIKDRVGQSVQYEVIKGQMIVIEATYVMATGTSITKIVAQW